MPFTTTRGKRFVSCLTQTGGIAGHAVLPRGKPEKDDAFVVRFACLSEKAIDEREIVFAFDGLDEFPAERGDDGVETHGGELRPQRLHVVEAGGRRVV